MRALLQISTTLSDAAGWVVLSGSLDACLDAWIALPHERRAGTMIKADGKDPDFRPDVAFPLDSAGIAKVVLMRENMEWP